MIKKKIETIATSNGLSTCFSIRITTIVINNQTEPNLSIGSTEIFLVVLKPNQLGVSDSTSIST